jgi:ADP-ribose pyrophosphatase YjhB (NUDIX family)
METSSHFPDSFYRVSVKGLYVRDGRILLTKDSTCFLDDGTEATRWELPGGGMDFGETFKGALTREVREEMGVEVTAVADTPTYLWTHRKTNSRDMEWYHILLLAFPFEVRDMTITPTPECQETRFFTKDELQELELNSQIEPLREMFDPKDFA